MKYHRLSTEERYEIAAMRQQKLGVAEMAKQLGRHRSTLYREMKRNQSVHDGCYRPSHAVEKASGRKHRSRRNWLYGVTEFAPVESLIRERFIYATTTSLHCRPQKGPSFESGPCPYSNKPAWWFGVWRKTTNRRASGRRIPPRLYGSVPLGKDATGRLKHKTRRFRSSLANAHVARCGWLGIH